MNRRLQQFTLERNPFPDEILADAFVCAVQLLAHAKQPMPERPGPDFETLAALEVLSGIYSYLFACVGRPKAGPSLLRALIASGAETELARRLIVAVLMFGPGLGYDFKLQTATLEHSGDETHAN